MFYSQLFNCYWKQTELSNLDSPPPSAWTDIKLKQIAWSVILLGLLQVVLTGPGYFITLLRSYSKLLSQSDQNIFITRFLSPPPSPSLVLYCFISLLVQATLSVPYYLSSLLSSDRKIGKSDKVLIIIKQRLGLIVVVPAQCLLSYEQNHKD